MYDRIKAIEYAKIWWNKRNPKYYNFDKLGGDCTNFISQCLHAGGIEMNYYKYGWFFNSLANRAPAWSGVDELYSFGINNASSKGVRFKKVDINSIQIGDVVQFRHNSATFTHALIVVKVDAPSPKGIFVACHTNDAYNKPLSDFSFQEIRFLKVLN